MTPERSISYFNERFSWKTNSVINDVSNQKPFHSVAFSSALSPWDAPLGVTLMHNQSLINSWSICNEPRAPEIHKLLVFLCTNTVDSFTADSREQTAETWIPFLNSLQSESLIFLNKSFWFSVKLRVIFTIFTRIINDVVIDYYWLLYSSISDPEI